MIYDFLLNTAVDLAKKRFQSGFTPGPDDTICVLYTNAGSVYTGVSTINANGIIHAEIDAINNMRSHGENVIQAITVFNSCTFSPILPCNSCINYIISVNIENAKSVIVIPNGNIRITEVGMFIASMNQRRLAQPVNYNMKTMPNTNYAYSPNTFNPNPNQGNMQQTRVNIPGNYSGDYNQMPNNTSSDINPQTVVNPQPTSSIYSSNLNNKAGGEYLKKKVNDLLGDDDDTDSSDNEKDKKKNKKKFGNLFN